MKEAPTEGIVRLDRRRTGWPERLRGGPQAGATPVSPEALRRGVERTDFVLTHQPPTDEHDPDVTFLTGDICAAVGTAVEAAAGKDVLVVGGAVAEQCVGAGLLDEILIHVAPVLLGKGIRLFERSGPAVDLEPISVSRSGRITNLRFSVVR